MSSSINIKIIICSLFALGKMIRSRNIKEKTIPSFYFWDRICRYRYRHTLQHFPFWPPFSFDRCRSRFWTTFGAVLGPDLGSLWNPLWGRNGIQNWTIFWTASWWPFGGNLGGFLAVLGLSWEAWCSRFTIKNYTKQQFPKSFLFAIMAPSHGFWMPCWLILGRLGPKMEPKNIKNWS